MQGAWFRSFRDLAAAARRYLILHQDGAGMGIPEEGTPCRPGASPNTGGPQETFGENEEIVSE